MGQLGAQAIEPAQDVHPRRVFVQRGLQRGLFDIGAAAQLRLGDAAMVKGVDAVVGRDVGLDVAHGLAQAGQRGGGAGVGLVRGGSGVGSHGKNL